MPRARSCLSTMRARAAAYGSTSPGACVPVDGRPAVITARGYAATPARRQSRALPAGEGSVDGAVVSRSERAWRSAPATPTARLWPTERESRTARRDAARRGGARRRAGLADGAGVTTGIGAGVATGVKRPPFPRNRAFRKISPKTTAIAITKTFEMRSSMWTARSEMVCTWSGSAVARRPNRRPAAAAPAAAAAVAGAAAADVAAGSSSAASSSGSVSSMSSSSSTSSASSSSSAASAASPWSAASSSSAPSLAPSSRCIRRFGARVRGLGLCRDRVALELGCLLGRAPVRIGHRRVVTPWCRQTGGEREGRSCPQLRSGPEVYRRATRRCAPP